MLGWNHGAEMEMASDTMEYKGHVVHVFCDQIRDGSYLASCEIWEDAAIVQETRSVGREHASAQAARDAAYAWAMRWIDANS